MQKCVKLGHLCLIDIEEKSMVLVGDTRIFAVNFRDQFNIQKVVF